MKVSYYDAAEHQIFVQLDGLGLKVMIKLMDTGLDTARTEKRHTVLVNWNQYCCFSIITFSFIDLLSSTDFVLLPFERLTTHFLSDTNFLLELKQQ